MSYISDLVIERSRVNNQRPSTNTPEKLLDYSRYIGMRNFRPLDVENVLEYSRFRGRL